MPYNIYTMWPHTLSRKVRMSFLFLFIVGSFLVPVHAVIAETMFVATPLVIDGKGKQREILRYDITLKNTTNRLVSIYPWVTDVDVKEGVLGASDLEGSREKALADSLARWIEVTRGSIDLLPGEEKKVPVTVQVNLNARPGVYHAIVHFSPGGDRASAEQNKKETVDVHINIEVLEDINERMQLGSFAPVKNIFVNSNAEFNVTIENIGNRGDIPKGSIRIYDRRGREIATIDANKEGKRLEPSAKELISSAWMSNESFGRYKAMLDVTYGNHGTLQDTVFFWVIPWKKLAGMFFTLITLCVICALLMHSYAQSRRKGLVPAFATSGSIAQSWRKFFPKASDEEYEIIEEDPKELVSELREVEIPEPIHTKLFSRISSKDKGSVRLSEKKFIPPPSHQIRLEKRAETKPDPEHIVNLRS